MTHIWQGLRSGRWLTPARIRGYSLILLGICAIAVVGWVAVSDRLIDRNGKPLGTDFSSRGIAGVTGIPLGLTVLLAVYVFTMRRAMLDREVPGAGAGAIAQA